MRCVFATLAAVTLQFAMTLPDAAAGTVEYRLTAIDIPGAVSSQAFDINNSGQILVTYSTANDSGVYIINGAAITRTEFPDRGPIINDGIHYASVSAGMNDAGVVVGSRLELVALTEGAPGLNFTSTSFIFNGEDFVPFAVPDAGRTAVSDINDLGHIVGDFSVLRGFDGPEKGFLYNGETFQSVEFPGSTRTSVSGINNLGQMVGTYGDSPINNFGFLFDGDEFLALSVPGVESTSPAAINDLGVVVGSFHNSSFNGTTAVGFVLADREYQEIRFPNAVDTWVSGINTQGEIVGYYSDPSGARHAFLGAPVPEPSGLGLLVVALLCFVFLHAAAFGRQRHRNR